MSIKGLASPIQVTGLTASGTTDGLGTWNEDVDLVALGLPAEATGVILTITNSNSSNRWAGARQPGKTNAHYHEDFSARGHLHVFAPLVGGTIDLYLESTSMITFHVMAYTDANFTWFDIDVGLPQQPSTGGSETLVTAVGDVPLSATMMLSQNRTQFNSVVAGGALVNPAEPSFVALDASNEFYANENSNPFIVGYDESPFTALAGTAITVTADSTWNAAGQSFPDASCLFLVAGSDSIFDAISFRPAGSAFAGQGEQRTWSHTSHITGVDANGDFETWVETGATGVSVTAYGFSDDTQGPQVLRKGTTFDVETTLGTITTATLNSVDVFNHVTGQTGATVSFEGAAADEITTSGEYTLTLGDGSSTENITVQVNVVGLPSLNLNKDGVDLASLTDIEVFIFSGAAGSRVLEESLSGITADANGDTGTVEIPAISVSNGDTVLAVVYTDTTPAGVAFTRALELI